ncbi:MAG: hypothetical protein NC041_01275 [Bacteroides sp.]|nr:hypothetical protein [Prevotella sp.]MCM1408107.1 hypothetical protein [Treponema brennaborense]MCM1469083.1 hypothetical protein [Bacteroides sp.]
MKKYCGVLRRLAASCAVFLLVSAAVSAEGFLSANDLKAKELTANLIVDDVFTITATPDKGVSINKCEARTAPDGEIFNQRIKLGGTGTESYRSIRFKTTGATEISVYLISSSKTDSRICRLVSAADGSEIGTVPAVADDGSTVGLETLSVPGAGEYYLTSKSSTIYIYSVYFD